MKTLLATILVTVTVSSATAERYDATWESLDRRPTPTWWEDAKFGIFIHWGPYAVPAYAPAARGAKFDWDGYAEWYQGKMLAGREKFLKHHQEFYGRAPYANFAAEFKARFFNAADWAELFKRAGAKYVVLTSKHHDGYALWPSPESPYYNSVAVGSGRDLAREFCDAMKAAGLRRGFYYSMLEYANPKYPHGRDGKKSPHEISIGEWNRLVNIPQLKELAEEYEPDILWPDGEWDYTSAEHGSCFFLAWLFNESKVRYSVVVNDRWGSDCRGRHGGHFTTEYGHAEGAATADVIPHPWEECRGIGGSFGYNRFETPDHYMSRRQCLETLVGTVSRGGNLLLNVGPDSDGQIPPIMQDRLLALGRWLAVNGEAIYASRRAVGVQVEGKDVHLTVRGGKIYVIDFRLDGKPLALKGVTNVKGVRILGSPASVKFQSVGDGLVIVPPELPPAEAPCEEAWVYEVTGTRVIASAAPAAAVPSAAAPAADAAAAAEPAAAAAAEGEERNISIYDFMKDAR